MGIPKGTEDRLQAMFPAILPHLDERQRRLLLGAEARALGHGGIRAVAKAAGVREGTVSAGAAELDAGEEPLGRIRRPGGGRKALTETDPGLLPALLALVEPDERGDPMSPLRWTTKSMRTLAAELTAAGHRVSHNTVAVLLHRAGFSLQGNAKVLEGTDHPDRDAQFRYLNEQARQHRDAGQPVISVDAKKKEPIGNYAAPGQEIRPAGEPRKVLSHEFDKAHGQQATPYGIYDVEANTGWVNVGTDRNTAQFAVESIRRWWHTQGQATYPDATRLLITADCGGNNGYRVRLWKTCLAELAAETGLAITVCHLPPGTSKWNKIEHRLFSHISLNWRGRPLTSYEVVIESIAATSTRTGLRVDATLDTNTYPKVTVTKEEVTALPLTRHDFHGDWNYTLTPSETAPATGPLPDPDLLPSGCHRSTLADPALTGLGPDELADLVKRLEPSWSTLADLLHQERFGRPRVHPNCRIGGRSKLNCTDRILVTILRNRGVISARLLGEIFSIDPTNISTIKRQTQRLFDLHGITINPAPKATPAQTLDELQALARRLADTTPELEPAC